MAREIGLKINEEKTKIVMQNRQRGNRISPNLTKEDYNFKVEREFPYLGSMIINDNDERIEISRRLTAANRTYFSLLPVLKSRIIHRDTKLRLYKTLIHTVVT